MTSGRGLAFVGVIAGCLTAALVRLTLLGFYVRPTSDDWCLIPLARSGGFNAVLSDVYEKQNGRLVNAAVLGVIFPTYDVASKVLPGVVLLGLLLMFFGVWRALLRFALGVAEPVASVCGGALAAGSVLALLLGKPHRYQTLYHAPTIVSHTMPILIAGVIVLTVIYLNRRDKVWPGAAAALLGGAALGTFNEAFTAVCLVSVVAGLALRWLFPRHAVHWIVVLAGGVGLLLGFVSVFLSPGSRNRQQLIHSGSLFDTRVIGQTFSAWIQVVGTAFGSGEVVLLLLVGVAVGVLIGAGRRVGGRHSLRVRLAAVLLPAAWALTASLGATFVLAYSFNGQLLGRERVWPSITVCLLLAGSWYAVLLGNYAGRRGVGADAAPRWRRVVLVGAVASIPALVLVGFGSLDLVRDVRDLATITVRRSVAWDKQQAVLHREVAAGAESIMVRPLPIDGLYEPFYPNSRLPWPAMCAPDFYGVDRVVPPPRNRR